MKLFTDAVLLNAAAEAATAPRHVLSACERYRYCLEWSTGHASPSAVLWVCVNPSTAVVAPDGTMDHDHTTRKITEFSKRAGFGRVLLGNLFAWRDKDIKGCVAAHKRGEAVGPENDAHLLGMAARANDVIVAWGPKPWAYARARTVLSMLSGRNVMAVDVTKDGAPGHPLTLGYSKFPHTYRAESHP